MAPIHPIILAKPHTPASSSSRLAANGVGDMNTTSSSVSAPASAAQSVAHSPAPSPPHSAMGGSSLNGSNPHTPPPTASGAAAETPNGDALPNAPLSSSSNSNSGSTSPASQAEQDLQIIIEALKSKDRIYVLKLGEQMESLIKERRPRIDFQPATSYQRLLVHRCSAYYKLSPEADTVTKGIAVHPTPESRIAEVRICELVPPESTSQPTFKIMRRSPLQRGQRKPHSSAGSVAGEDADLSDVEPSEAGSLGGRSNATGSSKKHMTIAEREAAYNEARSRIFHDFEEKEKAKESQMSASSSQLSLNSASATSAYGDASSLGEIDGSVSSPTTESERSGPARREARRGNASASSSRGSIRGGSRNSRASSPSFAYPSLYEPAPTGQLYDPNAPATPSKTLPPYNGTQYYHPFVPPTQPGGVYMQPYSYYPSYPYQAPPPDHHHNVADPSRGVEQYPPPPPMGYGGYAWPSHVQPPPGQTSPASQPMAPPHHPHPSAGPPMSPPSIPAQPYYPQPQYTYPPHGAPGFYPPPPPGPAGQQQQQPMAPPMQPPSGMQSPMYESPRTMTGPGVPLHHTNPNAPLHNPYPVSFSQNGRGGMGSGPMHPTQQQHQQQQQQQHPRNPPRSNTGLSGNGTGGGKRGGGAGAGAPGGRAGAWSYGPGLGHGGYVASPSPGGAGGGGGNATGTADATGPRLNNRRQSNTSASSTYSRASSINDDVSSIASSSTTSSSASRQTYTSTASSQHPLPARPDWAVGLKAQPNLAGGRETPGSLRHASLPISPARSVNGSNVALSGAGNNSKMMTQGGMTLQANDFPPLTPQAKVQQEKARGPIGAWGNPPGHHRAVLASPPGGMQGRAGMPDGSMYGSNTNLTEQLVNQIQSISIEEKIAAVELAANTAAAAEAQRANANASASANAGAVGSASLT